MNLEAHIRNVPDFPKPGVQFKDITTLLTEPGVFRYCIDQFHQRYADKGIEAIVAADARGFVFGGALAYLMGIPLVLARKKGKLPADTVEATYTLEYGEETLQIHRDALTPGQRVLILDDLLATGGTVEAIARLVRELQAEVVEAAFIVELPPLGGRERLKGIPVHSMVTFMVD